MEQNTLGDNGFAYSSHIAALRTWKPEMRAHGATQKWFSLLRTPR